MRNALVTIGIGPWDVGLGHIAWVVVPLLVAVVLRAVLEDRVTERPEDPPVAWTLAGDGAAGDVSDQHSGLGCVGH